MLSNNQAELLRRLAAADEPIKTHFIAEWRIEHDQPYGESSARNALKRLETRGLLVGSGVGRMRSFAITALGRQELAEHMGEEPTPEEPEGAPVRKYIVLEKIDLDTLSDDDASHLLNTLNTIYVPRSEVEARNVEHALRRTAVEAFPDADLDAVLVPVAERMFQAVKVAVRNRRSVSIG